MKENKIQRGISVLVLIGIAIVIAITLFAGFIIDYLWFSALMYAGVFWKILFAKFFYFLLFTILGFAILIGNFWFAAYYSKKEGPPVTDGNIINFGFGEYSEPLKQLTSGGLQKLNVLVVIAAAVLAIFTGLTMIPHWEKFLRFFNSVPFEKTDPIFGHDIGFYVFSLPVYTLFRGWLMSMIVLSFIGSGVIYWISGMFKLLERSVSFSKSVKVHLYTLIAVGLLLKAWDYRLEMYNLLYSRQGLVFGAGYTDYYIHRLALWVMLLYMLGLLVFTVSGIFSSKDRVLWLIVGLILIIPIALILQGFLPGLVQQMIVKPNELIKEEPFIRHNIAMTNDAYGLADITVKAFSAQDSITVEDLRNNEDTINNIRLWDGRPLLSTYQQIQAIRTYYSFLNVDVDRYEIDGHLRQVMLAARELEREKLAARAQTWVNTRLTFTHGYGIVMNPVNTFTAEGLPELFIKDIPPVSSVNLPLLNTAIYYGEQRPGGTASSQERSATRAITDETSDYVVVRTSNPEFDYSAGEENKYVSYEGNGGVWMGSLFRRLLFAWGFREMNILLTGSTTDESRIMFRRNIQDRIRHLAPFLELDQDPYIVLSEGRLFWIQDAYTFTEKYPYSDQVQYRGKLMNYIRNSVKIVIDAYHGSVDFYLMDHDDPLIKTYQAIFPTMFKDFSDMPEDLKAHIRYPQDLFYIQMVQYNTYHMQDPKVFYNKEDLWTIPKETYGGETINMEPYYIQMRLPGEEALEFILMIPLTPNNKDNMIAWLAARCDGDHYGELLVYKFPKEKLIYGPSQIEARINQDTIISQQFSLWDQRGSNVIRGNLMVIPIEDSILYVEPVYLKAEQRDLPELKRVIASHGGDVVMGMDLRTTLEAVFGGQLTETEQKLVEQVPMASIEEGDIGPVIQQLVTHFNAARQSLAQGDWLSYGQEMNKAEELIRRLQQQYAPQQ
ncbi:UPF0182 protein Hore_10710 [Candidatus Vecturithrix granuli]|uniref:UPF0182 protein U27_00381 n=1 Tax=Vecturithrix granuli TaxID=1499967 RepID=A0A081C7C9_VECG1|nr:UPF0182 protein Hore_10710 [Candidatus Vecturithrix granuli]